MANNKKRNDASTEAVKIPYLKIVLCLVCICTVCAAILGATYLVTKEPIARQEAETVQAILTSIYGNDATFEEAAIPQGHTATAVWRVKNKNGENAGVAIRTVTRGFSDDIDLIVGFDQSDAIRGIEIISLSETAGLGSLIAEQDYLAQYTAKSGTLELGTDIDAISGATKSSRALIRGVNQATECLAALSA